MHWVRPSFCYWSTLGAIAGIHLIGSISRNLLDRPSIGSIAMITKSDENHCVSDGDRTAGLVRLDQIARELTFPALSPREEQALKREQARIENQAASH